MERLFEILSVSDYDKMINEMGIDLKKINDKRGHVSYNPNHQNYVDTGNPEEPKLVMTKFRYAQYVRVKEAIIYSIFKRLDMKTYMTTDGNPLLYALNRKEHNGEQWSISKDDREKIMSFAELYSEQLIENYDTLITVPTSDTFTRELFKRILNRFNSKHLVWDMSDAVWKIPIKDILDKYIDYDGIIEMKRKDRRNLWGPLTKDTIRQNIMRNYRNESEMFSFNKFPKDWRPYLLKMFSSEDDKKIAKYSLYINEKRVLLVDDVVSSGSTLIGVIKALTEFYSPLTVDALTMLSPLYTADGSKPKDKNFIGV